LQQEIPGSPGEWHHTIIIIIIQDRGDIGDIA
jgi:hypothetical protein